MSRPNIVFVLADDLGYADLSCYGRRDYETPCLDQLSDSGLRLTQGYANSAVCSATRTALITGCYQYRFATGLEEPIAGQFFPSLPLDQPTLPGLLRDRGYSTHLVGKWHLGRLPNHGPLAYGYDSFFGFERGAIDYFRHRTRLDDDIEGDGLMVNDTPVQREGYLTDLLGDEAVRIVRDHDGQQPFFLSLHFNAPHWPWEGPEDEEISRELLELRHLDGGNIEVYGRMVRSMDANIGRVVEALKEKGIFENTLIVFTSDNGGERFSDVWPFIGVKSELFEGGLRVPLLVCWPDQLPAGQSPDQVMTTMDFLPTLLAATGEPLNDIAVDGEDLLAVLRGDRPSRARTLYWRFRASEQAAVRQGNWKYLRIAGREYLFDVVEDPRERANLSARYPELFNALKRQYDTWQSTMLAYPDTSYSERPHLFIADRY